MSDNTIPADKRIEGLARVYADNYVENRAGYFDGHLYDELSDACKAGFIAGAESRQTEIDELEKYKSERNKALWMLRRLQIQIPEYFQMMAQIGFPEVNVLLDLKTDTQ